MNAKSAGRRSTSTARDTGLLDNAIGGIKTGFPLAGEQRQCAGRGSGLYPGEKAEMAQVAAVGIAVLVDAARKRKGSQQGAHNDQAGKRPPCSCNLLWRNADGPHSIAAEEATGPGVNDWGPLESRWRRRWESRKRQFFSELEGRHARMSGMALGGQTA